MNVSRDIKPLIAQFWQLFHDRFSTSKQIGLFFYYYYFSVATGSAVAQSSVTKPDHLGGSINTKVFVALKVIIE